MAPYNNHEGVLFKFGIATITGGIQRPSSSWKFGEEIPYPIYERVRPLSIYKYTGTYKELNAPNGTNTGLMYETFNPDALYPASLLVFGNSFVDRPSGWGLAPFCRNINHDLYGFIQDAEYYRASFTQDAWWEKQFRTFFDLVAIELSAFSGFQHFAIVRKSRENRPKGIDK